MHVLPDGARMLTYSNVTDLVQHAEDLENLAMTDGLTGLCNRRHFFMLAEKEWTRFKRYDRPLSLLMLDRSVQVGQRPLRSRHRRQGTHRHRKHLQ
jgi:Diguanylate cyclase, GGDEF domain